MNSFKYTLSRDLIAKVALLKEFAMGGTQVSIRTHKGEVFNHVLISNCKHIVAIRGYKDLPFGVDEISDIFQTSDDENPKQRGGWDYWDQWK